MKKLLTRRLNQLNLDQAAQTEQIKEQGRMSGHDHLKILSGHTTQDTAYVVADYPYGFRLRCKIRYWLEYKRGRGFRLVSQTTDPKKATEVWNKPKASVYSPLGVMGLNAAEHVTWTGVGMYCPKQLAEFEGEYGPDFDARQREIYDAMVAAWKRYEARKLAAQQRAAETQQGS